MSNIYPINPLYEQEKIQEGLELDSMVILAHNMTANFKKRKKRNYDEKEVANLVKVFYNALNQSNGFGKITEIKPEWDQTS